MSLTEKVRYIDQLTDINVVKHKRTFRRGQLTKVKSKIEDFSTKTFHEIKILAVKDIDQTAGDSAELHDALQHRYTELICSNPDLAIDPEEEERDEAVMSRQRDIVVQAHQLVALVNQYQNGVVMQSVLQDVANLSDLTAPSVVPKIERLETKVSEFQVGTLDFAYDERIAPVRQQLKEDLQAVLQTADHKGKKDETVTPKATPTTIVNDSA